MSSQTSKQQTGLLVFTGQPIPKTFADYQALAAQKQDLAQRIASRDGGLKTNLTNESSNESDTKKCHLPKLRRVACHETNSEEKQYRKGLLAENGNVLDGRHSLKRKAGEIVGLLRK